MPIKLRGTNSQVNYPSEVKGSYQSSKQANSKQAQQLVSVIIIILLFSIQLNFPPKRNQHLELNMKHQNQLESDSQRY